MFYQNHIVSLSLRITTYICAFISSFSLFLRIYFEVLISWRESFFVKLIYCDPWIYIRTVVSTTIIFTLVVISHHQSRYWSDYRLVWLFQRLLSLQPSSQGASDEHTGRFPAGFALVYMIIYHALALYESGSDVAGVRGWLRTP